MKTATLALAVTLLSILSCTSTSPHRNPSSTEPEIVIQNAGETRRFTRSQLLKSARLKTITVAADPAYANRPMTYQAIPAADLFEGMKFERDATLVFKCLDGFSAPISMPRLLNLDPKSSVAYIAIEGAGKSWPVVKAGGSASAGPFYVVWENPERSKIAREEWPFQLSGFEVKASLEIQFPKAAPAANAGLRVRKGFQAFAQNCFACHRVNGEGQSQVGPDLNTPHNPTEYMKLDYLTKLIRDPQSLRHWPQARMPAYPKDVLSDEDLANIISYLQHMSKQKVKVN